MTARRLMTPLDFGPMVEMIRDGKAQITFIPIEEALYYIHLGGFLPSDFNIVTFPEMPPGQKRYILCSHQVEDAVIERLNAQIKEP